MLNKCRKIGLKLNPEKCIFGATEVPFFGYTVNSSGLCADPKKIQSIVNMPPCSDKTQLNSFKGMCNYLMNYACTLQYFVPSEPIVVECNGSKSGIGGILLQNGQPVMYISRALTKTQQCYTNIECELLAMVMVIEQLHHYLFGRSFTVHTDHSPLVQIFAKQLNYVSPRLQ